MKSFISAVFIVCLTLFAATDQSEAKHRRHYATDANGNVTYISNPCPYRHTAFCGCAARYHVGSPDRRLDLASNWPRYYTGPYQVAVWRHHVAVIDYWTGPHTAMLYDYNSGGHRSRHWERDVSEARIIGGNRHAASGFANAY